MEITVGGETITYSYNNYTHNNHTFCGLCRSLLFSSPLSFICIT